MKFRRITALTLVLLLMLGLMTTASAAVGSGWKDDCPENIKADAMGVAQHGKHNWVKQSETPGNNCTSKGTAHYVCSYCSASITRETKAPGHKWGSWKTTKTATCTQSGERTRTCKVCGRKETEKTNKAPHTWGEWTIITEATDHSAGERQRTCQVCGHEETESFDPEGTLRRGDRGEAVKELQQGLICYGVLKKGGADGSFGPGTEQAVKALEEAEGMEPDGVAWPKCQNYIPHQFGEWQYISELSDFSAENRTRTCSRCGYVETEEKWPLPLYRRGDKGDGVKQLQEALNAAGYSCGKPDGSFGGKTEKAVSSFEAANGIQADGIAWPGVLNMLGIKTGGGSGEEAPAGESDGPKPVLLVNSKTSKLPEDFRAGDELIFDVSIANEAEQTMNAGRIEMRVHDIAVDSGMVMGPVGPGEVSAEIEFQYQLTQEDIDAGSISVAFSGVADYEEGSVDAGDVAFIYDFTKAQAGLALITEDVPAKPYVAGDTIDVACALVIPDEGSPVMVNSLTPSDNAAIGGVEWKADLDLGPGSTNGFTLTITVSQEDVDRGWGYARVFAEGTDMDTGANLSAGALVLFAIQKEGASVMLIPEDVTGMGGALNDIFPVKVAVINNGTVDLKVTSFAITADKGAIGSGDEHTFPSEYYTLFPAGSACTVTDYVHVNADDVKLASEGDGFFDRVYEIGAEDPATGHLCTDREQVFFALREIYDDTEPEEVPTGEAGLALTVIPHSDKGSFSAGEEVAFTLRLYNGGSEPVENAAIRCFDGKGLPREEYLCEGALPAGEYFEAEDKYVFTDDDAAQPGVILLFQGMGNVGDVFLYDQQSVRYTMLASDEDRRDDRTVLIPPNPRRGEMEVVKSVVGGEEQIFYLNDVITFEITVTNNTGLHLDNVAIYDHLNGAIMGDTVVNGLTMDAGDSYTDYYYHTVDTDDVAQGYVINYARAWFSEDGGDFRSNDVRVFVKDKPTPPVTRNPEPKPTPTPRPADCCVRTLMGVGDGEADFTLDYCGVHGPIADAVTELIETAETPDEQLDAWQESIEIWTEALNAEYDAWLAMASEEAKPVIVDERVTFYLELSCLKDELEIEYPDDPATVAARVSEQLMNKTADLCYERHTAPKDRVDSLLNGTWKAIEKPMKPGDACDRLVARTDTGAAYQEVLCQRHRANEMAVSALIRQAKTPDAISAAWQTARQLWLTELDVMTNERALVADEAERAAIEAERAAFGSWLKAREAMLSLEYPDRPDIVGEVVAQTVRARVLDLCGE